MKSKQYAKRLLSLIIASVMIVTMLPVSALAAGVDDVMIEDQAETIVEEAVDVSGEVVEEAAEVPDIEDSEDAAIVDGAVDEIAEEDPEELTGFTDGTSLKVEGVLSGSNMQFDAQLTGLSVSAVVPAKRAAKGSYMTADIVDVSAYEDAVAKKNYGKSIAGLYGLELHFYDKKDKEIKHINTSKITVTVDGLEASSYFIGRIDNKVKKIQRGTEPTFTFTEKKAYTYVIAGLEDDGLVRASGESDGDGNKRFNLNDENVDIEVVAPEGAFADGVAMEASDVTNGAAEDGEDALVGASADDIVAAYNISFYNEDGAEQQPSEAVTVTINVPLDMTQGYELIHIADDGTRSGVDGAKFSENGVTFTADSFSVYAVLRSPIQSGQQYVIYSGTTAFAYDGTNISTATVNVTTTNGQTVVEDADNDNIVWTLTAVYGGWYISCTQGGTTRYLHFDYDFWNGASFSLSTDPTAWAYNSTDHYLYYDGYFDDYYFRSSLTRFANNTNQRGRIYMAHVEDPGGTSTGDLDYYYYNADATTEIAAHEKGQSPSDWTDVSQLAKPIPGYHFLEARANSKTGDIITEVNGKKYRKGVETGNGHDLSSIYFIYMTDYTSAGSIVQELEGPDIEKKVERNDDGTYKIRLDITGKTNTVKHGANVVVVFDITSSMSGRMSSTDSTQRINAAISAVNQMVTTLNPGTGANQNDIDFALVEFARTAKAHDFAETNDGIEGHTKWTKSGTALNTRVNHYKNGSNLAASGATEGGGGTNWQAALQETARLLEDKPDNDITYVVFMTDGEPTFYIDATSVQNRRTVNDPEYYKAVPYATTIVNTGYHMWDIFCSSEATTLLSSLQEDSGADSYIKAESATAIKDAFKKVAEAMLEAIGSQNAAADDGVPQLGSFDLDTIDGVVQLSNAKYYIKPSDGTETEWADAPPATPSDAGVEWDLSDVGTLEDGTVYSVVFDIWPSQDAYDLIADLNNGVKKYEAGHENSITAEERAQVEPVEGSTDRYTLKTNTSLSLSYDLYGETHNEGITNYPREKMPLPTEKIFIRKDWNNELDAREAANTTLTITKDGVNYIDVIMGEPTKNGAHEWTQSPKEQLYISCGFMTVSGENVTVKSSGHDYTVIEPAELSWYWDLTADVYHPMVINGTDTMLIKVTDEQMNADGFPAAIKNLGDNKTKTSGGKTYYKFGGKLYVAQSGNTLQAYNDRRSRLLVSKQVSGTGAPADAMFKFAINMENTYGKHSAEEGYNSHIDGFWFTVIKNPQADIESLTSTDLARAADGLVITGATAEDNNTGFYWFDNVQGGHSATISIKAGWRIYFTNIRRGAEYSVLELGGTDMPERFVFNKVETSADNQHGDTSTPAAVDANNNMKVSGSIDKSNTIYHADYTNNYLGYFYVYHSSNCKVERYPMAVNGVARSTFNIFERTADGTLYGGYFDDYAGKSASFDAGTLTYTGSPVPTATDAGGTAYSYAYIKTCDRAAWNSATAYTQSGKAMTPVKDTVYYLKEVPTGYLQPYTHYTYKKGDKSLQNMWYISANDDLRYDGAGFFVETFDADGKKTARIVTTLTVTNSNGGATVTLSPKSVFGTRTGVQGVPGVQAGYLTYLDAKSLSLMQEDQTSVFTPFWYTPDHIYVCGIKTRTINFNKVKVGSGNDCMRITDADNATPFPNLAE